MRIERVAVLGAGVMGAQIAALLANAGIEVELLDLGVDDEPSGRARAGLAGLARQRPPALYLPELAERIRPGSLEDIERVLPRVDWVIEAIVEDLPTKIELYRRLSGHLKADAVLSSNTSGLSIATLAEAVGEGAAGRFLGVHFFNPPRYMRLVEIIPAPQTEAAVVDGLTAFLRDGLGKGVVRSRDTPNFIANRLGIFALLDVLHRMPGAGLGVEAIDAATGPPLGRPRSATLRLCDLIGLDTLLHVARTSWEGLPEDPARATFSPPVLVERLVAAGHLGAKSGAGFYRKGEAGLEALDLEAAMAGEPGYRPVVEAAVELPARGPIGERLAAVWAAEGPAGGLARQHLAATLAYCAGCAGEVADGLEDVDRALRWGFNWEAGPFEIIDHLGAAAVAEVVAAAGLPMPALLREVAAADPGRIYLEGGQQVWDGNRHRPLRAAGPPTDAQLLAGAEVMEDGAVRVLYLGDGAGVIELRGKLNVMTPAGLDAVLRAVGEEAYEVLLLTGTGGQFCAGADLGYVLGCVDSGDWEALERYVRRFQETTTALRYATVPVVAAARGLALGGGCELCLSAAARVAAGELRMGLVETRVGVVPAGGGSKEMVRRFGADVDAFVPGLLAGRMSDNALQARRWGFLDDADAIHLDDERLLATALERARTLLATGWQTPTAAPLAVAGPAARERLDEELTAAARAGDLSAHDVEVGRALARVVCGGDGAHGSVSEEHLLELEREAFLKLCATAATKARMEHMLRTGKPLRN